MCLQLLLKYPAPDAKHGPHTFVDDAVYLRDHLDFPGGSFIVQKYTERSPATPGAFGTSSTTVAARRGLESMRQRALRSGGSALPSVAVEQFIQGAAKSARGVLERGEKLGINQAVREAMGELRRNMQNINDGRVAPRGVQQGSDSAAALAAMDKRGKQLAAFLGETVADLKALSTSNLEDKAKSLQLIEVVAAKVQFVQVYLEDSTMDLPQAPGEATAAPKPTEKSAKDDATKREPATEKPNKSTAEPGAAPVPEKSAAPVAAPAVPEKENAPAPKNSPTSKTVSQTVSQTASTTTPIKTSNAAVVSSQGDANPQPKPKEEEAAKDDPLPQPSPKTAEQPSATPPPPAQPQAPAIPRSTIAQSSFSWMLEPDESTPSAAAAAAGSKSPASKAQGQKKRHSNNVSRDRNAFLFGDGGDDATTSRDPLASGGIFGLESMGKSKGKWGDADNQSDEN